MYYLYYETTSGNYLIPYSSMDKLKSELKEGKLKGFHPKILKLLHETDSVGDLSAFVKKNK